MDAAYNTFYLLLASETALLVNGKLSLAPDVRCVAEPTLAAPPTFSDEQ